MSQKNLYENLDRSDEESCDEKTSINSARSSFSKNAKFFAKGQGWCQRIPKRYILAIMSFLGFFNVYALRVNLSIAIVAMVSNTTTVLDNGTIVYHQDYDWDTGKQGVLLSAFFWGYIITQIPGGLLASRYGPKKFFGTGILCTALFTLLTPLTARIGGFTALLVLRIIEGLCEGITYPAMHALWGRWAPPLERSKLVSITFSGSYVGTVVAMPLSGILAEHCGWPSVFYFFGAVGTVWFVLWSWVVTETPETHTTISDTELDYIITSTGGKTEVIQKRERKRGKPKRRWVDDIAKFVIGWRELPIERSRDLEGSPLLGSRQWAVVVDDDGDGDISNVPWKQILTSGPVWAIIVAHFSETWGFYTLLTELPSYLKDVLHFNLGKTGFLSALPYMVMAIVVQFGGQLADFTRQRAYLTTTQVRKLFNCLGFMGQMIFMIAAAFTRDSTSAVVFLTLAVGIGGFATSGFGVNHLDVAPQVCCQTKLSVKIIISILMGVSNCVATIPGIVSPPLTGMLVKNKVKYFKKLLFRII
ncbi:Vesicular glutamate transporter 3 [Nymphon striatum]|nr:Vesicular glutamate transporter 3 [Nymphon striatum]